VFRLSSDEGDYLKCQVGISSRGVRRVFTFVAQQKMLCCATKGWVVAQGGWRGVVGSKERCAHLLADKCALLIILLAIVGGISIAEFCDS
jgi:hypothetical protein